MIIRVCRENDDRCDNGEPYIRKIGEMYGYYYEPDRSRMYFVLHSRCPICRLSGVRVVDLAGSRYWIDGMGRLAGSDVQLPVFRSLYRVHWLRFVRVCLLAGLVLFFYLEHQIGTE